MMVLFLVRHADAVGGTGVDFTRTPSEKGRKQAKAMGERPKKKLNPGIQP